ncbi:hypothetical protein AB0N73_10540 [Microbacterium sp. NPDC089189]|uniref:hypothetical protein n=1 Tax=Microbacterium sp. NPDC089189 TaxID=3154972 RepID=UPI00341DEF32
MRKSRVAGAMGWWIVLLLVTIGALVITSFSRLSVAGCSESCDYGAFGWAMYSFYIAAAVILFAALGSIYLLRDRGWFAVAAPLLGMILLVVAFAVSYAFARAALDMPLL